MRPSHCSDLFSALKQLAEKEGGKSLEIGRDLYISFREKKQLFVKVVGETIYLTLGSTTVSASAEGVVLMCSGKATVEVGNPTAVVISTKTTFLSLNGNKLQLE